MSIIRSTGIWPSPEMHPDWRTWAHSLLQRLAFPDSPPRLTAFRKADLPPVKSSIGALVYCTDALPKPQPVFCDGVSWNKVTDGNPV